MIKLEQVAKLKVSAASGCVIVNDAVHVVADDDVSLHVYGLDGSGRGSLRLLPDEMPSDEKDRKKRKPDFEALTALPGGRLLAIGSGSTSARERAIEVSSWGPGWGERTKVIDAGPLFTRLRSEFSELNIEGCAVHDGALWLAQRGNGAKRENGLIRLKLDASMLLSRSSVVGISRITLEELDGVPLSITDLCVGPGGVLHFSAAAEDTDDPYLDGECTGSVIGAFEFVDGQPRVAWTRKLDQVVKIEGLAWHRDDQFLLVADADDPTIQAPLFRARLKL